MRNTVLSLGSFPLLVLLAGLLLLPACGDDAPTAIDPEPSSETSAVLGTYDAVSGESGVSLLTLRVTGDRVEAELVVRSRTPGMSRQSWLPLKGTLTGTQLVLQFAPGGVIAPDSGIEGELRDTGFTGVFSFPGLGLEGAMALEPLPLGETVPEVTRSDLKPRGVVHDGQGPWVSTLEGTYLRLDDSGSPQDTLIVFRPGLDGVRLASAEIAEDDGRMWSQLPLVVVDPDTTRRISTLFEFDTAGTVVKETVLDHPVSGLGAANGDLWSLPIGGASLLRLGPDGQRLEEVLLDAPDVEVLDYDGTSFWAVGWYTALLYRIDRQGNTLEAWTLPRLSEGQPLPGGISWDGSRAWYVAGDLVAETTLFRLRLDPVPE